MFTVMQMLTPLFTLGAVSMFSWLSIILTGGELLGYFLKHYGNRAS